MSPLMPYYRVKNPSIPARAPGNARFSTMAREAMTYASTSEASIWRRKAVLPSAMASGGFAAMIRAVSSMTASRSSLHPREELFGPGTLYTEGEQALIGAALSTQTGTRC